MKRVTLSVVILAMGVLAVVEISQAPSIYGSPAQDAEKQLIDLEKKWTDLSQKKDAGAVEALLADDYAFIGTEGDIGDKALLLKHMREGEPDEPTYKSWQIDQLRARVYGKTGVVTGHWVGRNTDKDPNASIAERWTDVWVNQGGFWKCVASHSTTVVKK